MIVIKIISHFYYLFVSNSYYLTYQNHLLPRITLIWFFWIWFFFIYFHSLLVINQIEYLSNYHTNKLIPWNVLFCLLDKTIVDFIIPNTHIRTVFIQHYLWNFSWKKSVWGWKFVSARLLINEYGKYHI